MGEMDPVVTGEGGAEFCCQVWIWALLHGRNEEVMELAYRSERATGTSVVQTVVVGRTLFCTGSYPSLAPEISALGAVERMT